MNDSATPSVRQTPREISLAIAGALGVIALAFAVAFFLEKRDMTWLDIATALHGNRNPFGALMRGFCVIAGVALVVWAWRRIGRERIAPRPLRHAIALFAPLALVPFALFLPREWGQGGVLAGLIALAAYRFLRDSRRTPSDFAAEPSVIQAPRPPNRIPRPERISAVVVTLFAVLFIALNIKRIAGFEPWYDHALFMDVAKRTVGGEPFASAFVGPNILSHHFMPILFPISHLWGLFQGPYFFPVVHALAIATSAWLLFQWAERALSDSWAALAVLLTYVLCTRTWMATVYFFYPEGLEPAFFFGALLFIERLQPVRAVACVVLLLSCKEDAMLLVVALSAYAAIRARLFRTAAVMLALALVAAFTFFFFLPRVLGRGGGSDFFDRYGQWGATAGGVALGLVSTPHETIAHLFSGERLASILKIGFPLLWIPFRAGGWSLALLVIGLHLLSGYGFQQRLGGHYFLLAAPVIWFCLVLSLRKHYALRAVSTLRNVSMAAVVGIVAWNLFEPWTVYPPAQPPGEVAAIKKLLAGIPDGSKVAADPRYLPYLYARTEAVPRWFVDGAELARGVVEYVAIDHSDRVSQETESAALIDRLKATRNFEVVVDEGNHNLLRYRGP